MRKWQWMVLLFMCSGSMVAGCRDPKQDWSDRNPRKPAVVPASSRQNQPTSTAPDEPMDQSIKCSVLVVAGELIEVQDVLDDVGMNLAGLGHQPNRSSFIRAAIPVVRQSLQRQVGEILLYKEAVNHLDINADKEKKIAEAVDNILFERVAQLSGGNRVEFERQVIASGRTMDGLKKSIRRALLVHQYLREKLDKKIMITRAQLQDYYNEHLAEYCTPAKVKLDVIRVSYRRFLPNPDQPSGATTEDKRKARDTAKQVTLAAINELNEKPATQPHAASQPGWQGDAMAPFMQPVPASFERVAESYSDDPSTSRGGHYGLMSAADFGDRELAEVVFDLAPGGTGQIKLSANTLHGPLESESAFFLIQTGKTVPATVEPFRNVQGDIERKLRDREQKRLQDDYLEGLFNKCGIEPDQVDGFAQTVITRLLSGRR